MTKEIAKEFGTVGRRLNEIERRLSDFATILNERQQGDIDFLAMETGVDLDMGEDEEGVE